MRHIDDMKPILTNFFIIVSLFLVEAVFAAEVKTRSFSYEVGGQKYQGYIADGATEGKKAAGVLVVHEWWGQNEYPRERARQLAQQGYVAFAIDMFGEGKTAKHPKEAQKFAAESMKDPKQAKKVFDKALSILKEREDVADDKIAAIGFCYGGSVVLNMASMGSDLDLVGSFHGGLSEDYSIPKREDNPRILIFNGAADPMVTEKQIKAVKNALEKADVNHEFVNYEGAKHAFTNPGATEKGEKFGLPLAYDKKAAEDAWGKFLEALKKL